MLLDLSFAIRVIRDVYNRCGFSTLSGVYAEKKGNESPVTDIDPLVEHIVEDHLNRQLEFSILREEKENKLTTAALKEAAFLVTIDGIDGTGDFIRHFNRGEYNAQWLVGMTAVYKRKENGRYDPILSFAYQPHEDRLFFADETRSLLVKHPLSSPQLFKLSANNLPAGQNLGSIDVYFDKGCAFTIVPPNRIHQMGPSGFNMASLAAACAPFEAMAGGKVNFTTFHYFPWDFGLWPVLHRAGVTTSVLRNGIVETVAEFDLNWFGVDQDAPDKCEDTPIILSGQHDFNPLQLKPAQ